MPRARRFAFLLAVTLAAPLSLAPRPASAQGAKSARGEDAAKRFGKAQELFESERYEEALPIFQGVYEATRSPNARLYVARTLAKLGRTAEARDEMAATHREAKEQAEREARYVATRDAAAAELALLEPKVGKLVIRIPEGSGGELTVNGKAVPLERLVDPVTVEPGRAVVVLRDASGKELRKEVEVGAGRVEPLTLEPEPEPEPEPVAAPKPPPPKPPPPPGQGLGTLRTAGIVSGGVGLVNLVVGGVAWARAGSRLSELEEACGGQRCPPGAGHEDAIESGKSLDAVATMGLVMGLVGLAAGGTLFYLGSREKEAPRTSLELRGPALRLRHAF